MPVLGGLLQILGNRFLIVQPIPYSNLHNYFAGEIIYSIFSNNSKLLFNLRAKKGVERKWHKTCYDYV
jgi:hypothetical protein